MSDSRPSGRLTVPFATIPHELIDTLSPNEILVYLGIKRHYPNPFPSLGRLVEVIGISLAAVKRALKSLMQRGLVLTRRTGRSSLYVVSDDGQPLVKFPSEGSQKGREHSRWLSESHQKAQGEPSDGSHRATKKSNLSRATEGDQPLSGCAGQNTQQPTTDPTQQQDGGMHNYGAAVDDDGQTRKPKPPKQSDIPKPGTRAMCMRRFMIGAVKSNHPKYNEKLLGRYLGELRRGEGKALRPYSWEEIEALIEVFFARHAAALRTDTKDIGVAFNHFLPQVQRHASESLRDGFVGGVRKPDTSGVASRVFANLNNDKEQSNA